MAVLPTERLLHLFHLCLSNHVLVCVILQWFVYRYLLFKPDREELFKLIDDAKSKITGQ
jgi:hypothetical protein